MALSFQTGWNPTLIRRVEECYDTGSDVVAVVTNEGRGFAKFLGNREGPHVLACELMGTRMAHLMGLPTFDHAVIDFDGIPDIKLYGGNQAVPGPAWITRREEGFPWGGKDSDLALLANRWDVAKLVTLDTWILNCDRHRPHPRRINRNNVFLSREGAKSGQLRLVAMDHTHTFTCGRSLSSDLAKIDSVKEDMIFGWFPEFADFVQRAELVTACESLAAIPDSAIREEVERIPQEWEVDAPIREALLTFLRQRRDFVAEGLVARLFPQSELEF